MKFILVGILSGAVALGAGHGNSGGGNNGGGGGNCTNTSLKWEVQDYYIDGMTPSQVISDGQSYEAGVDGVGAQLDTCGGTLDGSFTILDQSYGRDLTISFGEVINRTDLTPTTGTVSCMKICWHFVVRNLGYAPLGLDSTVDEYQFTTHLAVNGPLNSHVWMMNDYAEAEAPVNDYRINDPYQDSLIVVHHCPANFSGSSTLCSANKTEQWFVWPEKVPTGENNPPSTVTYVASWVIDATKGKNAQTGGNGGEFRIPFYFIATALP